MQLEKGATIEVNAMRVCGPPAYVYVCVFVSERVCLFNNKSIRFKRVYNSNTANDYTMQYTNWIYIFNSFYR